LIVFRIYPVNSLIVRLIPAAPTTTPTIILNLSWSSLNAPSLEPIIPPTSTVAARGMRRERSGALLIECPIRPAIELVNMNKLAVAAVFFVSEIPVRINRGDNQIPPPIPTSPANVPSPAPVGTETANNCFELRFISLTLSGLLSTFLIPDMRRAADAAKRAIIKIIDKLF